MNIEHHLSTLKPANQPELARRILAIPAHRRQRRRDCVFGFGGLLTGIAATLLVVMWLPSATVEVAMVQYVVVDDQPNEVARHSDVFAVIPAEAGIQTNDSQPAPLDSGFRRNDDAGYNPIDLDEWIARYERLLRHRHETASRTTFVRPRTMTVSFNGVSPLEYRNKLMQEI